MASASSSDLVSTTHYFKAPWIGTSRVLSPLIRELHTCGAPISRGPTVPRCHPLYTSPLVICLYMRTEHLQHDANGAEKTHVVTDGIPIPEAVRPLNPASTREPSSLDGARLSASRFA